MDKVTISRIMVENKRLLPVTKADTGVYVVDIPKAAGIIYDLFQQEQVQYTAMQPSILEQFDVWLKETKRGGSVLVGSSIREFFRWYE